MAAKMTNNVALIAAKDRGWLNGFSNLWRKENHQWWGSRRWLIQIVIWMAIINGIMAMLVFSRPIGAAMKETISQAALMIYYSMSGIGPAVGVVILGQEAIILERQLGTAAWVLSKPISRIAFILAKLSSDAVGILVTMVLVPGLVASQIYRFAAGKPAPFAGFLAGMGLVYLSLLFYLALTLMLGTLFRGRGPVIGIPILMVFGSQLFGIINDIFGNHWSGIVPFLGKILPWNLVMDLGPALPSLALALAKGQPLPTMTPILGTAILAVLFLVVAIARFEREEF